LEHCNSRKNVGTRNKLLIPVPFAQLQRHYLCEWAYCREDLIDSVALDPRCPPHKSDFMRRWFEERGIRVVQSKCFGYLADDLDLFSEE
jgi:hypothetical protein